jgi:hypothetical protein
MIWEFPPWFESQPAQVCEARHATPQSERMIRVRNSDNFNIDPEAWSKFDPQLRRAIAESRADPEREWPVMIVLVGRQGPPPAEPPQGRRQGADLARERHAEFEEEAAELIRLLRDWNARPPQVFWIGRSLGSSLRLSALEAVGRRPEVRQILLVYRAKVLI